MGFSKHSFLCVWGRVSPQGWKGKKEAASPHRGPHPTSHVTRIPADAQHRHTHTHTRRISRLPLPLPCLCCSHTGLPFVPRTPPGPLSWGLCGRRVPPPCTLPPLNTRPRPCMANAFSTPRSRLRCHLFKEAFPYQLPVFEFPPKRTQRPEFGASHLFGRWSQEHDEEMGK